MCRESFEFVGRGDEGQAGDLGHIGGDVSAQPCFGVQAGADGGAALSQFINASKASLTRRMPIAT